MKKTTKQLNTNTFFSGIKQVIINLSSVLTYLLLAVMLMSIQSELWAESKDNITLAVVGPMSGKSKSKGEAMLEGMQMCVDEVNADGGVAGKMVELIIYDDQNNRKKAEKRAQDIINDNKALIVLGHRASSTSVAAGKIYQKNKIPAITGTATADNITENNDWYFSAIFNNSRQGKQIAFYMKEILKHDTVSIISDEDDYGYSLHKSFKNSAEGVGLTILDEWSFNLDDGNIKQKAKQIVEQLSQNGNKGAVFMATHDVETVYFVKEMKDRGLDYLVVGGASVGKQSFSKRFKKFPLEKSNPGYYSDGIYASTYFIYDVAGKEAQQFRHRFQQKYKKDPGAQSASSYDVAAIAIDAIKNAELDLSDIHKSRQKIRDHLASKNSVTEAFSGVSGKIFFDKNGTAYKSVPMAVFNRQKLISAPIQLNQITNYKRISNIRNQFDDALPGNLPVGLMLLDDMYMQQSKVVYTGVKINEIKDFDEKALTYTLDFYLWFRFQGELDIQNLEFLNADEPIDFNKPLKQEKSGQLTYRLYRLKGRFKADFIPGLFAYHQHLLGVSFHHRELSMEKLVFVGDVLNMGTADGESLLEQMRQAQVMGSVSDWSMNNILFYQDIVKGQTLGSIESVKDNQNTVDFSKFNLGVTIKKNEFTLRGLMPIQISIVLAIICFIALIVPNFMKRLKINMIFPKTVWLYHVVIYVLMLMSLEILGIHFLLNIADNYYLNLTTKVFDILWWWVPGILFCSAIGVFIWNPLEKKTNRIVPGMVRGFVTFIIYILLILAIIAFVFDQKITSLLATSGVIAMIIGLAIQINISNIFSGIVINIELPFRIKDWVKIGSFDEGEVVDITWRSTRVKTRHETILCIPNSVASESTIQNFDYPTNITKLWFTIHIDPRHPYKEVEKILYKAAIAAEGVLNDPAPIGTFQKFTEWSGAYWMIYYIDNYGRKLVSTWNLWKQVNLHLERAGMKPLTRRQDIQIFSGKEEQLPGLPIELE